MSFIYSIIFQALLSDFFPNKRKMQNLLMISGLSRPHLNHKTLEIRTKLRHHLHQEGLPDCSPSAGVSFLCVLTAPHPFLIYCIVSFLPPPPPLSTCNWVSLKEEGTCLTLLCIHSTRNMSGIRCPISVKRL